MPAPSDASRCHQLLEGLSGGHRIEGSLRPAASQDPRVPQPLLPLGRLRGHGDWAATVRSPALTSSPASRHGWGPFTGLVCSWLEAKNLSAGSLRCWPSSALVRIAEP